MDAAAAAAAAASAPTIRAVAAAISAPAPLRARRDGRWPQAPATATWMTTSRSELPPAGLAGEKTRFESRSVARCPAGDPRPCAGRDGGFRARCRPVRRAEGNAAPSRHRLDMGTADAGGRVELVLD